MRDAAETWVDHAAGVFFVVPAEIGWAGSDPKVKNNTRQQPEANVLAQVQKLTRPCLEPRPASGTVKLYTCTVHHNIPLLGFHIQGR